MKLTLLLLTAALYASPMSEKDIQAVDALRRHHGCGHHCEEPHGDGVPEPSTWLLIAGGLVAVAWRRRRS
jgi:hypothetical protein